jgi:hypothetical protein
MERDHHRTVFIDFEVDPPRAATHGAVLLEVLLGRSPRIDVDLGRLAAVGTSKL